MQAGAELKHWMFGASGNRIKVIIHMAYGIRHVGNLIAPATLRCGGLDIRLPQPTNPRKQQKPPS
ncbi:hypothetical protein BCAL_0940 [Bifidobacterium callitrichos DSM 23973]|uniref:Uncharacterized protein n=1 Tax=Bifidobacterium callitrichos DSM 23973 TaxID=1437609 RepID=A0A087A7D1_9BIFI|nr:hypothetical protein BCAL_0940 [Bifidobacterium callitrichos DSM 23973]